MSSVPTAVHGLAALYPGTIDGDAPSDDLVDALAFIDSSVAPETVVQAGYGAGLVALLVPLPLALTPLPLPGVLLCMVIAALLAVEAVHSFPYLLAALRRTRALGDTPNLIGRAVLRMQIQPATENAVRFAADTGLGPLSDSLAAHIKRSMGTPRSGLLSFADEWAEEFPAIRRSAALLATAQDAPEGERGRTLDRALAAILDGTRERMAEYTNRIQGPTTGLYAFGVMLPLALVALVPAAGMAGFSVSIWMFVLLYDIALPAALIVTSGWLLVNRPVAFPPPNVTRAHPDVPDSLWLPAGAGLAAGAAGYVGLVFAGRTIGGPGYLAPIAAFGLGIGSFLLLAFKPVAEVREYVREVEEHLVDALYIVGRRVDENEAVESAIAHAAERVPGETGEVFAAAAGLQRRLHTSVEAAFLGEYGALKDIPSPRARSTAALLSIAADEGQPAGRAIVSMADHLEELQEVESETRRQLSTVTGTLQNTAAFFGPLVGGATVGLAGGMSTEGIEAIGSAGGGAAASAAADAPGFGIGGGATDVTVLPADQLGLVVGVYILLLCLILVPLSVGLKNGLDRSLVGYVVGQSLVVATPVYVATVWIVGSVM